VQHCVSLDVEGEKKGKEETVELRGLRKNGTIGTVAPYTSPWQEKNAAIISEEKEERGNNNSAETTRRASM